MVSINLIITIIAIFSMLIVLYIILRNFGMEPIPYISGPLDYVINRPFKLISDVRDGFKVSRPTYEGRVMYYETKKPKTGYWNPTATEKDMLALWERDGTSLPEEMHENNSKSWIKFHKTLDTEEIDAPAEEYRHYDPKSGIMYEHYEIVYFEGDDDEPTQEDAVAKYNFRTGEVTHEINI